MNNGFRGIQAVGQANILLLKVFECTLYHTWETLASSSLDSDKIWREKIIEPIFRLFGERNQHFDYLLHRLLNPFKKSDNTWAYTLYKAAGDLCEFTTLANCLATDNLVCVPQEHTPIFAFTAYLPSKKKVVSFTNTRKMTTKDAQKACLLISNAFPCAEMNEMLLRNAKLTDLLLATTYDGKQNTNTPRICVRYSKEADRYSLDEVCSAMDYDPYGALFYSQFDKNEKDVCVMSKNGSSHANFSATAQRCLAYSEEKIVSWQHPFTPTGLFHDIQSVKNSDWTAMDRHTLEDVMLLGCILSFIQKKNLHRYKAFLEILDTYELDRTAALLARRESPEKENDEKHFEIELPDL